MRLIAATNYIFIVNFSINFSPSYLAPNRKYSRFLSWTAIIHGNLQWVCSVLSGPPYKMHDVRKREFRINVKKTNELRNEITSLKQRTNFFLLKVLCGSYFSRIDIVALCKNGFVFLLQCTKSEYTCALKGIANPQGEPYLVTTTVQLAQRHTTFPTTYRITPKMYFQEKPTTTKRFHKFQFRHLQ